MASGSRAGPQIIWKAEEHDFIKETDLKGKRAFPELCRPRGVPRDSESDGKVPHGTGLHSAWGNSETSQMVKCRAHVDRVRTALYSLYQCIQLRFHNKTRVQVKKKM